MPWSPVGPLIFDGAETSPIDVTVSYSPEVDPPGPSAISYQAQWTSVKFPTNVALSILPGAAGIRVIGPNIFGLVDIRVDYLLNGVPGFVTSWSSLPPEAEQIYKYSITGINVHEATFEARANLSGGGFTTALYTIRVNVNYTTGRDILIAEVDARR